MEISAWPSLVSNYSADHAIEMVFEKRKLKEITKHLSLIIRSLIVTVNNFY